jgi:hypothetical protein
MPKKKPAPPKEVATPVSAPAQWHKRTAVVTGELSYAVIKRKMLKSDVARWRDELTAIAGEMDALVTRS